MTDSPDRPALPRYDDLPVRAGAPAGASWGVWGDDDRLGSLNLLTPSRARRGAGCVRSGRVFPLDLDLALPDPPVFRRPPLQHRITSGGGPASDDLLQDFNTQSSTQWDGFRHFRHADGYYNGLPAEAHGVHHWAEKGLVGRGVLADVDRWRTAAGRPLRQGEPDPISVDDLVSCLAAQRTDLEEGDILLVRTGWLTWYLGLPPDERPTAAGGRPPVNPGLASTRETAAFLWDSHVAAVAADNPAVEAWPVAPEAFFLHPAVIGLLGIPFGELFAFDDLADDCAAAGTWDMLVTSAPMHLPGGAASPPNAVAVR